MRLNQRFFTVVDDAQHTAFGNWRKTRTTGPDGDPGTTCHQAQECRVPALGASIRGEHFEVGLTQDFDERRTHPLYISRIG